MGVSATHLDWTMVPYVRKSFYKHYKNGLEYIEHVDWKNLESMDGYSIDNAGFKKYPKVHQYAMDMTIKEIYQAVEGLYHNLNY